MTSSREYWEMREKQKLKANLNDFKKTKNKINKNLEKIADDIEVEILKLQNRYADKNLLTLSMAQKILTGSEYKKWRMDLEEYIKEIGSTGNRELLFELNTLSAKSQISILEERFYQIQKILNNEYSFKHKEVESLLKRGVVENYKRTAFAIESKIGIHTGFSMLDKKEVENIINLPWSGKSYSERLWNNRTKLKNKLEEEITKAIVQGKDLKESANEIRVYVKDHSSKVAERLINTEHCYACSQGDLKMYEEFNVTSYEYLATLDLSTSAICRKLDGKKFKVSEAMPGVNFPPMHCHCRSTTVPDEEELENSTRIARDKNNKNISIDGDVTYEEWYKKYVKSDPEYLTKEKKWKNRHIDKKQFEKYKEKYGTEIPKNFEKFQDLKYNNSKELEKTIFRDKLKSSVFPSEKSLNGHFEKHSDKLGIDNKEEYLRQAQELLGKKESENILRYKTELNRVVVYDKNTNRIVIYQDGKIRTFLRPKKGIEYYYDQYRKDVENI